MTRTGDAPDTKGCYLHFAQRVEERIGTHIKPKILWQVLSKAVQEGDSAIVTFVRRISRTGRRLWRFQIAGEPYFLIYDHELECPITVLASKGRLRCHPDLGCESVSLEAGTGF